MKRINDLQCQCEQLTLDSLSEKPVIAVCGLMNAGKSYLLNMLTQHIEEEYFKTADQRETITNKILETEQYIYLDTPGLDANVQDDAVAQQGISNADIVLFVHQPQGELDRIEMDFLRQLKGGFGKSAKYGIVIVFSKVDKEEEEKIDAIEKAIREQCLEALGITFTTFQVSSNYYKEGVNQKEDILIKASRIDALARHFKRIRSKIRQARQAKRAFNIERLLAEVEALTLELRDEKAAMQKDISDQFSDFNAQMNQLQSFLIESASSFKKI